MDANIFDLSANEFCEKYSHYDASQFSDGAEIARLLDPTGDAYLSAVVYGGEVLFRQHYKINFLKDEKIRTHARAISVIERARGR